MRAHVDKIKSLSPLSSRWEALSPLCSLTHMLSLSSHSLSSLGVTSEGGEGWGGSPHCLTCVHEGGYGRRREAIILGGREGIGRGGISGPSVEERKASCTYHQLSASSGGRAVGRREAQEHSLTCLSFVHSLSTLTHSLMLTLTLLSYKT